MTAKAGRCGLGQSLRHRRRSHLRGARRGPRERGQARKPVGTDLGGGLDLDGAPRADGARRGPFRGAQTRQAHQKPDPARAQASEALESCQVVHGAQLQLVALDTGREVVAEPAQMQKDLVNLHAGRREAYDPTHVRCRCLGSVTLGSHPMPAQRVASSSFHCVGQAYTAASPRPAVPRQAIVRSRLFLRLQPRHADCSAVRPRGLSPWNRHFWRTPP